ncbi:hypothetical protein Tco_0129357 [Tanacetum coccineum]
MGDENPPRTLGEYSRPSHEDCRNTIELPEENNVVPLRSDTIRLVQNGCAFHGLRSEDPNQHLEEDSLDLNVENRERTRLRLFQFSLCDQARNWLERLPTGYISTWILEANPLLILKTFECLWLHTLHFKPQENEFESFSGQCFSKYIRQLILCPHEIQLNHFIFHLLSDEIMSDVDVFRPGVLDVVAAESYGTLVVTIQRDVIVSSVDEMDVLVCFFDDQLTNLSPRNWALPDVLLRVS